MAKTAHLENAVMDVLWERGEWLTTQSVLDHMGDERSVRYTTVMTVLTRLWKKGRLERQMVGRAYAYRAKRSRAEAAALRMEEILDAAGDRSVTLSRFLENLSPRERERVRNLLDGP